MPGFHLWRSWAGKQWREQTPFNNFCLLANLAKLSSLPDLPNHWQNFALFDVFDFWT